LIDFGVAKSQLQRQLTQVGILKGKFPYMAPEQLAGGAFDHRVDLFSLGVCLWEMITGRRLFRFKNNNQVVRAILMGNYPLPSEYRPNVPKALDRLVKKALHLEPDNRFQSASAFQLDCEDLLKHLPGSANSVVFSNYLNAVLDQRSPSEWPKSLRAQAVLNEHDEKTDPEQQGLSTMLSDDMSSDLLISDEAEGLVQPYHGEKTSNPIATIKYVWVARAFSLLLLVPAAIFVAPIKVLLSVFPRWQEKEVYDLPRLKKKTWTASDN
jgi:serine/threonine protein kinase